MYGIVVFIVCCHFISLYYLPREGPLLLLQAVQKALSRLILSFCKDNHFFWEFILFLLFFSLFLLPRLSHSLPRLLHSVPWLLHSVPWLLHSLPRLSHSVPRLSHSLPWFCCHIPLSNVCPTHPTCRGRSFKKMPGVLKLLPLQGALLIALYPGRCPGLWASAPSGRAACVFCPANCFIPRVLPWAESFCPLQGVLLASFAKKKRSHFGLFCHKGFTVLRHLWRFGEYLWREGSRPESPLFIGLSEQMWRVNPRFLLYTHTRKKINKERKQQYG